MEGKEDKSSYDLLLEDNNKLREEFETLKSQFTDMYEMNKSLLNSKDVGSNSATIKHEKIMEKGERFINGK